MRSIMLFVIIITGQTSAGPARDFKIHEENENNYIIYEYSNGVIQIEDFTNGTIETYATESDITFYFHSRYYTAGVRLKSNEILNLPLRTNYNASKHTVVIIHGWKNTHTSTVNPLITEAVLESVDMNVFVVDWSPIARRTYLTAQGSVRQIGSFVGDFIIKLSQFYNQSYNSITIVGHSLGAHIAGNAGTRTSGRIGTIVGLDPAGPLFNSNNIDNRLDPSDGVNVKVIHTSDRLGSAIQMGRSDYYPNGGRSQPGCGLDLAGTCSHSRAYHYYAESLSHNGFLARSCESYDDFTMGLCDRHSTSFMGGIFIDKRARGDYFLDTNSKKPFGRGTV